MTYRVTEPTRLRGISIPRSVPPVFLVVRGTRRLDRFLHKANAEACTARLNHSITAKKEARRPMKITVEVGCKDDADDAAGLFMALSDAFLLVEDPEHFAKAKITKSEPAADPAPTKSRRGRPRKNVEDPVTTETVTAAGNEYPVTAVSEPVRRPRTHHRS